VLDAWTFRIVLAFAVDGAAGRLGKDAREAGTGLLAYFTARAERREARLAELGQLRLLEVPHTFPTLPHLRRRRRRRADAG
jgi:hypothetical protein